MSKNVLLMLLLILVCSCSSKRDLTEREIKFANLEHRVLDVNSKYKDIWIPNESQLKEVKIAVCNLLNNEDLKNNIYVNKLNSDLQNYRFQFIGFKNQSSERIWCNLAPRDSIFNWENEIVKSENLGLIRFELEYDVKDEQCYKFDVKLSEQE